MIDMQGIVLADNVQQAERNLQELDSVDWAEVKAELEPVEFANAFMDREGYLTLAEDVKDFLAHGWKLEVVEVPSGTMNRLYR